MTQQGPQLLAVGAWVAALPLFHGAVIFEQSLPPCLGQVQQLGFFSAAVVLHAQGVAHGLHLRAVELAHELADILHLAAFALEIGDFFGTQHRFVQQIGQVSKSQQLLHQVGA